MINESKNYDLGFQLLSNIGPPSHSSDVQDKDNNFYLRDKISRPFSWLHDKITKWSLSKLSKASFACPVWNDIWNYAKTSKKLFHSPHFGISGHKQCVDTNDSSVMNVCVCMIHKTWIFDSTEVCFIRFSKECNSRNLIDFISKHWKTFTLI